SLGSDGVNRLLTPTRGCHKRRRDWIGHAICLNGEFEFQPQKRDMNRPAEDFLSALNSRSQDIFKRLVERYLETGVPVGSRDLSRLLSVGLSPASVRNVMADLEDLGLIAAPHTSAGRQPTQEGLRFFVDAMLEVGAVDERERTQISR